MFPIPAPAPPQERGERRRHAAFTRQLALTRAFPAPARFGWWGAVADGGPAQLGISDVTPRIASYIAAFTALAVATPVLGLVWLAATPTDDVWPHLLTYVLPQAALDTLLMLLGVGLVALIAGAGPAWIVSRFDFAGRRIMVWLLPLPLAIPTYIAAYVYVDLCEPLGFVHRVLTPWLGAREAIAYLPQLRTLPGATAVIGIVLAPYVYFAARTALQMQSAEAIEAARTLGASRIVIFRRITWPSLRPALSVGFSLVALETLNDIGASEYLGVRTLTVAIFTTWLNRGSLGGAAQLALTTVALVALLIVIERRGRAHAAPEFSADNPQLIRRTQLGGWRNSAALALCLAPVVLGFAIPCVYLAGEGIRRGLLANADPLLRAAGHSVAYAALACVIALILALAVVMARRWRGTLAVRLAAMIAPAGYGLPGLVLALGLLAPLLAIDNGLSASAAWLDWPWPRLLLVGSGGAVVIVYVIRFLAVPCEFLSSGLAHIPADYDDGAAVAGGSRLAILRRVHLPLLAPSLGGAALVVFVDALKELPATLLLRPLNVETLATSIYQYASRGSFEDGAAPALLIVAASIGPVIWLTRVADRSHEPTQVPVRKAAGADSAARL